MRAWWAASSPAVAPRTLSSLPFTFSLFPVLFTFTNSSSRSSRSDANAATSFPKCCILSSEEGEREMDATAREPSERALFRRTPNTGEVSNWGSRLLEYKKKVWEEHSYFFSSFSPSTYLPRCFHGKCSRISQSLHSFSQLSLRLLKHPLLPHLSSEGSFSPPNVQF